MEGFSAAFRDAGPSEGDFGLHFGTSNRDCLREESHIFVGAFDVVERNF
jgi:hypothetical protein